MADVLTTQPVRSILFVDGETCCSRIENRRRLPQSFVALAVVLHMSRAEAGAWKMVGSYFGISLVGFFLMTVAGAYVDHALRPVLCTPPTSV